MSSYLRVYYVLPEEKILSGLKFGMCNTNCTAWTRLMPYPKLEHPEEIGAS
jgi:hypothetical protein